uniref:Uncharacterized protein n=1 Tax=Cannabis sativa TaxID=3483 RepID=A0A803NXR0_CANSA
MFVDNSFDQWCKVQGDRRELCVKPISGAKVKVDATIFPLEGQFGIGFIVHDPSSLLVVARAHCCLGSIEPDVAE